MPRLNLAQRHYAAEQMDDPLLPHADHLHALDGLARINTLSRSARLLWREILPHFHARRSPGLTLLDVATGSGDVPVSLALRARRRGLNLHITALDRSHAALDAARLRARQAGLSITFQCRDVLADGLPAVPSFDVVTSSLFLHHVPTPQVPPLLRQMADATSTAADGWLGQSPRAPAGGGVLIISDLRRCLPGYGAAVLATRLLTRSPIVRNDGPASVQAAFSAAELLDLAAQAGLHGAQVRPCYPWRLLLTWRRP